MVDQSWVADVLAGYKQISWNGTAQERRNFLDFGAGFTVFDDPNTATTKVVAAAAGFATTTANFNMPAVSSNVSVAVTSTAAMAAGLDVFVETAGYFSVVTVTDSTHVVLENLGTAGNASPTTLITLGQLAIATGPGVAISFGTDLSGNSTSQTVVGIRGTSVPALPVGSSVVTLLYNEGTLSFSWGAAFTAGGDLSGTATSQTVVGIHGDSVPSPSSGFLHWTGSAFAWDTPSSSPTGSASGDLSGTYPGPTVAKIQGIAVSSTTPTDAQILMAQSSWTPRNVANLAAWYRSDLGVTLSGGTITAWADQSGNGDANRNLTSSTAPNYVSSDANFNGHASIDFSVSSSYLRSGIWSAGRNQPITVFVVGKTAGNGGFAYWVDARVDTGTSQQAILSDSSNLLQSFAGSAFLSSGSTSSSPQVISAVFNDPSNSKIYVDNVSAAATGSVGTNNADGITIGNYAGGGGHNQSGNIVEVIVYFGTLSNGDFDNVMGYLGNRYAISVTGGTVPSTSPSWVPVTLATDVIAAFDTGQLNVVSITGSSDTCSILCDSLTWTKTTTGANLLIAGQTTDAATHSLFIHGQDAWSSATTNLNGGDVHISGGAASQAALSAGTGGNIYLTSGFPGPSAGSSSVIISNGQLNTATPTTDVAPTLFQLSGGSAWSGASTHTSGADVALVGGSATTVGPTELIVKGTTTSDTLAAGGIQVRVGGAGIGGIPGDFSSLHFPWRWSVFTVTATTGTDTLSNLQSSSPIIRCNVSLTGNLTVALPNTPGYWLVDTNGMTLNGHTFSISSGSTTSAALAVNKLYTVVTYGSNTLSMSAG